MMRALASLVLLGMLVLAPPAGAVERVASFPAHGANPVGGPIPVGDDVRYGRRLADGRWWLGGSSSGRLEVLPAPDERARTEVTLAASRERVAWARTDISRYSPGKGISPPNLADQLFAARAPGSAALLDDCRAPEECSGGGTRLHVAVDGDRVAWVRTIGLGPPVVNVDDSGGHREIALGERDHGATVLAAGGRLAYARVYDDVDAAAGREVVLLDGAGRERLRVASSRELTFLPDRLALQPDGKLVVWAFQGPVWFTAEEPYAHAIPYAHDAEVRVIGAAGDRIAFVDWTTGAIRLLGFDGTVRTVAYTSLAAGAGFDGTTLAWAEVRCGNVSVWRTSAAAAGPPWRGSRLGCPAFGDRVPVLRGRRLLVTVRAPGGFRGRLTLEADGRRIARKRIALRPSSAARTVRVALRGSAVRKLRGTPRASRWISQRLSGRDRTGDPTFVEQRRRVRVAR